MKHLISLLLFVLFFSTFALAQQKIKVSLKPDSIRIGELSELRWEFSVPAGTKIVSMPLVPDSMPSGIEVVQREKVQTSKKDGVDTYSQKCMVSAYDSGYFSVPALLAQAGNGKDTFSLKSDSVRLHCTTVPVDTSANIKEIKDIYTDIEPGESAAEAAKGLLKQWWFWALVAALIIGGFLFWYWRKKKKPETTEIKTIQVSPAEMALQELRKMRENRSWFKLTPKDFYTTLVDILRKYLLETRDIQAEEMLSSELIDAAIEAGFATTAISSLRSILQIADMAKFAKYKPEPGQFELSIEEAIEFVQQTRPVELKQESHGMDA